MRVVPPASNWLLLVPDATCRLRCIERVGHDVLQYVQEILGDQPLGTLDEQRHRARWLGVLEKCRHGVERTNRVLARTDRADCPGCGCAIGSRLALARSRRR